jgi:hypothetical protein
MSAPPFERNNTPDRPPNAYSRLLADISFILHLSASFDILKAILCLIQNILETRVPAIEHQLTLNIAF